MVKGKGSLAIHSWIIFYLVRFIFQPNIKEQIGYIHEEPDFSYLGILLYFQLTLAHLWNQEQYWWDKMLKQEKNFMVEVL